VENKSGKESVEKWNRKKRCKGRGGKDSKKNLVEGEEMKKYN
jgi:hypothetical protein